MASETPDAGVQPGQVLAGKYRVERVLGAGAMGVVVAAMHLELDEPVALKFLAKSVIDHPDAIARFAREARAAAKIKSEHVARVSDVGRLESGAPYLVMEYLNGTDVEKLVASGRPIAIETAVGYVLQACEAIAEAHAIGIIHRDLKPANLFVARRADGSECLKVLDFGISKVMAGTSQSGRDAAMTHTTAVMGTPLYMSPEQMNSPRDASPRSDIWSLGAILHELLVGRPPFDAESLTQLAMMIVHREPPPMIPRRGDVPPPLEAVVRRCLAKDPAGRFANVAELASALAPFSPAQGAVSAQRARKVLLGSARTDSMAITADPVSDARALAPTLAGSVSSVALSADAAATRAPLPKTSRAVWALVVITLALAAAGVAAFIVSGRATRAVSSSSLSAEPAPSAARPAAPAPEVTPSATSQPSASVTAIAAPTAAEVPAITATAASPPHRDAAPSPRQPAAPPSPPRSPEQTAKPRGGHFNDRN